MPTVQRIGPNRFFFYSLENIEPPHIHVEQDDRVAKFWLEPLRLAEAHGFRTHEIARLHELVLQHRLIFLEAWNGHFGGQA